MLAEVDRATLYKSVEQILANPNGRTRGTLNSVFRNLSFEKIQPLLSSNLAAIEKLSPSGVMFSTNIRTAGLELLAKYDVRKDTSQPRPIDVEKLGYLPR